MSGSPIVNKQIGVRSVSYAWGAEEQERRTGSGPRARLTHNVPGGLLQQFSID